ncbi:DUF6630 family protein [Nocardia sp. R16R-3T]
MEPHTGVSWSDPYPFPPPYSSPTRSIEYSLMSVAVLLAPDAHLAGGMVEIVSSAMDNPDELVQYYRGWLSNSSRSQSQLAREGLLASMQGGMVGREPFLVLCDWRESADDIHEQLRPVPSRPAMSWDQPPGLSDGPSEYPRNAEDYLRETARQSREAGMTMIRITRGDSYYFGFIPTERCELLLADAAAAGFTYENGFLFEIVTG